MKDEITNEIIQQMLPYLDNMQVKRLQEVLVYTMYKYSDDSEKENLLTGNESVYQFIDAKRVEGCSEKTLKYYEKTIMDMLNAIGKEVMHIMTEIGRAHV